LLRLFNSSAEASLAAAKSSADACDIACACVDASITSAVKTRVDFMKASCIEEGDHPPSLKSTQEFGTPVKAMKKGQEN